MPKLKLNSCTTSFEFFDNGCAYVKLIGPIGVNQSKPKPTELLILLLSFKDES